MTAIDRRTALLAIAIACSTPLLSAQAPARIVSTSPSLTETLFALGVGDRVVGVSTYCRFPTEVAKLPKVGTFLKPDPEIIARLRPDLVFVHTGPSRVAEQLATLGIRTAIVDRGTLSSVFTTIRQIGTAAGVPERAQKLLADIQAKLERVKSAVAGRQPKKVLIIVGRRTGTLSDIVAVGRDSYLNDLVTLAGGQNVLGGEASTFGKPEYPRISMETVIKLSPDVIIDIGEMGETPADSEHRKRITEELWKRQTLVKAVRENGVRAVHDEPFVIPGPRVVVVAETLAEWFHGVRAR
jgi:iron complex transport system substrate-binding protein